jgi:hypothetical protein
VGSGEPEQAPKAPSPLERASRASKDFFTGGSTFSTLGCGAAGLFIWSSLGELYGPLGQNWCGLLVAFLLVFAYALVLPEPPGSPNEGKLRITTAEAIFGFLNTFIVYGVMVSLKKL